MSTQRANPLTRIFPGSTQNEKENNWQGHNMSTSKSNQSTRIMFHNIRHLPLHGTDGFEMFIHAQSNMQVDLQGISEHCLDTTKFHVYQTTRDILRRTFHNQATIQLNSSSEPAQNIYKPGGTGIIALGQITSRLEPMGKGGDPLGRWSYVHLRRKQLPPLTIISVYQVCPRPTNLIGNTAYHQQQRALNMVSRQIHPRQAFMEDIHTMISELLRKNHDIIVGGDFNESLHDKNSRLLQLTTTHGLIDPFLHKFPHHDEFGTHINGRRRIDIALVTPRVYGSIVAIGYGPFDFNTPSDHRPLLIDFDTQTLFGQETVPFQPATHRGVKTKDASSIKMYVNALYNALQRTDVFRLHDQLANDSAASQMVEYIDEIIGKAEDEAEKRCKRRRPEFYSRTIVQQRLALSILRNHLQALKSNRDRQPQLIQKMQRTGVTVDLPPTQHLTRIAIQEARSRLIETSKSSFTFRQAELAQDILVAGLDGDHRKTKRLKAIKKAESGQRMYHILKTMKQGATTTASLDRVEIPLSWPPIDRPVESVDELEDPKTCNEWRLITEPAEVEYYLMLRNRLHFGQAEGTPFTRQPLKDDLDWSATTPAAEQMLNGTYVETLDTPQCKELLMACKATAALDCVPHELTIEEFRGKILSWRESTTTSPSGRHLGRYKALFIEYPMHEDDHQDQNEHGGVKTTFAMKQEAIARLKLSIINYCLRNNYVLQRWKTVVNVMIFKEPGNYRIHRLRVIHIYEADFNALLAIKWRKLLHLSDNKGLLNEGQYGGRPGCEAPSLTLLEELKYDISYLTRRSLFNFDNDATSCYDRILVPLASIINRKYGLDRRIVALHANTLQQAEFRLKTATGVSDISYHHCANFPIHGTGQGSGNSPSIWLFISSTLFDVHASQSYGATFISPDGSMKLRLSMVGFVDDSTGSCNDFRPNTQIPVSQMCRLMEHDAQLWSDLLYCSGGRLELPKCSFHVLHFDFLPNGKPVPSLHRYNDQIHVLDPETREPIAIPAKRSFESHKTLGHQKSPYSSTILGLSDIQKKADRIALLIATSPISRQSALLAYHTVFLPSIKYTLPQSFFPRKKLDQAQTVSTRHILAKCGYNRNTARALVYAPTEYAGAGFLPWYLLQGEGQVTQFLKHWRTATIISQALRITVQWAQWQSGLPLPILEDVRTEIPYLECRWITSLRTFLKEINAAIYVDEPKVAPPERADDEYIMAHASTCGIFTRKDLEVLNYCRLYLHVTTVSELFLADGETMNAELFHCRREPWFNPNTYVTLQARPTDYHVRTKWQRLCRQWTTAEGKLAASMKLGKWKFSGDKLRRRRETYVTSTGPKKLYSWYQGSYWEYRQSAQHPQLFFPFQTTTWEPTQTCIPIHALPQTRGNIIITRIPKLKKGIPRSIPPISFTEFIRTLAIWEQQLILGICFRHSPYEILHRLNTVDKSKDIYLVSDGSQVHNAISYGWVCGTADGVIYAEHNGQGYGSLTSHRAEAWGMLSALLFFQRLITYTASPTFEQHPVSITAFSDNSGLITRNQQRSKYSVSYPNATLDPDWDIVEQIYAIRCSLQPSTLSYAWVKGHQDNTTNNLTIEAQYNVRADYLAGSAIISGNDTRFKQCLLPSEKCRFAISNKCIYGHYISEIRRAYTMPAYYDYLAKRHGWTTDVLNDIDWDALAQAARKASISTIQILKLVHEKLPTRYELAKSNSHTNPACHYCSKLETFTHLMQCDNNLSQQFRIQVRQKLEGYFFRTGTNDKFRHAVMSSLDYWLKEPEDSESYNLDGSRTTHAQRAIGWHLFPKGFLTIQWRLLYDSTCTVNQVVPNRTSVDFISGIIQLLWQAQLSLWDQHQSLIGDPQQGTSLRLQDKHVEYSTRIRILHNQRDQCLHAHREQYFHEDVESFVQNATAAQMKAYLHHYEPAIRQSVRDAKKAPIRTLFTFQGFTRRQTTHPPRCTTPYDNSTHISMTTGASLPHKHTRWKVARNAARSIRNFFLTPSSSGAPTTPD